MKGQDRSSNDFGATDFFCKNVLGCKKDMSRTCPMSSNVSSNFPEDGTGHCQLSLAQPGMNIKYFLIKSCLALKQLASLLKPSSVHWLSKKHSGLDICWHQVASSHGRNSFLLSLNNNHLAISRKCVVSLVLSIPTGSCGLNAHLC